MEPERANSKVGSVVRALRRVNFQGSIFGQSIAIRLGLSESDIDALELLIDTGAASAGRLAELMGLTTGAVTRVIDRLEQAGYVRRFTDPADRRRVIVEIVPERIATLESMMASLERAAEREVGRYSPEQLATIHEFLGRMADLTGVEAARLRTAPVEPASSAGPAEHVTPLGGLTNARLTFRSGAQHLRLRTGRVPEELYRARFEGATPQVRVRDGRVLVQYRGLPFDWRKRVATIALNPGIGWVVEVVGGVQRLEADLRGVRLDSLSLVGGSERLQLELGRPTGEVPLRVVGGSRTIRVERPAGVPIRLKLTGGSGRVDIDGRSFGAKGGDVTLESTTWTGAGDRYALDITGGVGDVTLLERPD
jgi:DNA-binding MarR family transcriptional regulator